jgi:hypothetical protein
MKIKHTLITVLVLIFSAPAFSATELNCTFKTNYNSVSVETKVRLQILDDSTARADIKYGLNYNEYFGVNCQVQKLPNNSAVTLTCPGLKKGNAVVANVDIPFPTYKAGTTITMTSFLVDLASKNVSITDYDVYAPSINSNEGYALFQITDLKKEDYPSEIATCN